MSKKKQAVQLPFKFKGFENVEFNDTERGAVLAWIKDANYDPIDCATVLVEAGYKVGLGYDDYSNINVVSLTCKDSNSPYFGTCFTFRHSDIGRGLQIARYLYDTSLIDEIYHLGAQSNRYDW